MNNEEELIAQLELPVTQNTNGRMQVVKSNKLIQAQYALTATQQKLLSVLIAHVNPTEDYEKKAASLLKHKLDDSISVKPALSWRFTKQEIQRVMTVGSTNVGKMLLQASEAFRDLSVTYQEVDDHGETKFKIMNLVNEAEYDGHEFKISFTPAASRELYNLAEMGYTKYLYENIDRMNNKYAIRLYEIIQKVMHPRRREQLCKFSLQELQFLIGATDSDGKPLTTAAKRYAEFKRSILVPSIEHVNSHTNLELELIDEIRVGRKVQKLEINAIRVKSETPEIINELMDLGVSDQVAKKWHIIYEEDVIRRNITYMNDKIESGVDVKNKPSYLAFLVENNIADIPMQANPYSSLYSNDLAAQQFVKLHIMPNWWVWLETQSELTENILKEGITGSFTGRSFKEFKEHFILNTVSESLVRELTERIEEKGSLQGTLLGS